MGQHAFEWRTGTPLVLNTHVSAGIDIHHIFPRAWCAKNGIDAGRMDCIVNKTAISSATNQSIGGRAPSDYLGRIMDGNGPPPDKLDTYLQSHHIVTEHLIHDDFESFFAARKAALLRVIQQATGKMPLTEAVDAEAVTDEAGITTEEAEADGVPAAA